MAYYAQTNYQQLQGINGKYRIYDIGCFLTAFCNLELDYNKTIDPLTLNNFFRDSNIFIDVDDGIRDDVDWSFIQRWDSETRVDQLGSGGWPNSNQAIVKFSYTSPHTGGLTTHFCKVYDYVNQQIVDSWDGQVKHISSTVYGQPVAWAIYQHSPAQSAISVPSRPEAPTISVTPFASPQQFTVAGKKLYDLDQPNFDTITAHPILTADNRVITITAYLTRSDLPQYVYYLEDASVHHGYNKVDCTPYTPPVINPIPSVINTPNITVPQAEKYTLVTTLVYFPTAEDAKQRTNKAVGSIFDGTYYVVGRDAQAIKLSKDNKTDIGWINSNDNRLPTPEPIQPTLPVDPPKIVNEPVDVNPAPITDITPVAPKQPLKWGWINDDHQPSIFQYQGTVNLQVIDLESTNPPIVMAPGTKKIVSRYTMIGTKSYLLPDKEFNSGKAYGIDEDKQMVEIKKPTILDEIGGDLGQFFNYLETGFKSTARLITDISPVKISHATQRTKQAIDGFNSKRKVK